MLNLLLEGRVLSNYKVLKIVFRFKEVALRCKWRVTKVRLLNLAAAGAI